ncbi:MAG TPA: hypothetical protein VK698_37785 [Kofleriaceae bacterium]|jgi:hypothetical protein|nr:hypothetical protein [Kofleriaceae bacterium]
MRRLLAGLAAALALGSAACAYDDPGMVPLDQLDQQAFTRDVQPIFEARCATLDCHGVEGRPLRLYAETGLRLRDDLRDLPMTDEEVIANVRSAEGVDPGARPDLNLILRKPLAEAAGGVQHEGGDLWLSRDEPQAACVVAWLAGQSELDAVRDACIRAGTEVALPPPPE